MADPEHLKILRQGVEVWNAWKAQEPSARPDLTEANLFRADLRRADLRGAHLHGARLVGAELIAADLSGADLSGADLREADLVAAHLVEANLSGAHLLLANLAGAHLRGAHLDGARLSGAKLTAADLRGAHLIEADLIAADLIAADLSGADLRGANLSGAQLRLADLRGANLGGASLNLTNLVDTNLTGCRIYGLSAWNVGVGPGTIQEGLIITPRHEPEVTVDDLEVAQFVYLLLHNDKIRRLIDTLTSKVVLILGRFTPERKAVLDALREELRKRHYVPILFDFDVPAGRDITETVSLLARMSRFIIADLTEPSSIPKELEAIVPHLAAPVQPLLEGASRPYAMFTDYWKYEWVLPVYRYEGLDQLLTALAEKVIGPAETKMDALAERRRAFEAELTKSR